jgi:hypothetical protein
MNARVNSLLLFSLNSLRSMFNYSIRLTLQTLSRVFAFSNHFTMSASTRSQGDVPTVFKLELLNTIDLFEVSLPDLQKHMSDGKFSSVEYVKFCLERIRKVSKSRYARATVAEGADQPILGISHRD